MKCDKVLKGEVHPPHWHVVMAGNVLVAQGECQGLE